MTGSEVQDKLRAAQRDLHEGLDVSTSAQTVGQFLDQWLEDVARPTARTSTYQSDEHHVRYHIKPAIGHIKLAKLTPQHVQRLLNSKSREGLSPRTAQLMRATLRRALGYAVKWSLVSRNVAILVDPPRMVTRPVHPLTGAQARRFIEFTKG
jgi:site-specific recombinase XerD